MGLGNGNGGKSFFSARWALRHWWGASRGRKQRWRRGTKTTQTNFISVLEFFWKSSHQEILVLIKVEIAILYLGRIGIAFQYESKGLVLPFSMRAELNFKTLIQSIIFPLLKMLSTVWMDANQALYVTTSISFNNSFQGFGLLQFCSMLSNHLWYEKIWAGSEKWNFYLMSK